MYSVHCCPTAAGATGAAKRTETEPVPVPSASGAAVPAPGFVSAPFAVGWPTSAGGPAARKACGEVLQAQRGIPAPPRHSQRRCSLTLPPSATCTCSHMRISGESSPSSLPPPALRATAQAIASAVTTRPPPPSPLVPFSPAAAAAAAAAAFAAAASAMELTKVKPVSQV